MICKIRFVFTFLANLLYFSIIDEFYTISKPNRIWNWNPKLIRSIAKIGTKLLFPLNVERLQKLTENYVVSNEKIKKALGIEKLPIKAEDGFIKTIKGFEK